MGNSEQRFAFYLVIFVKLFTNSCTILAIDFVQQLKRNNENIVRENEMLRHELESVRHGVPPFGHPSAPHPGMYGPPQVGPPYGVPPPGHPSQPQQPLSRPGSSQQNAFPSGVGTSQPQPTANGKSQASATWSPLLLFALLLCFSFVVLFLYGVELLCIRMQCFRIDPIHSLIVAFWRWQILFLIIKRPFDLFWHYLVRGRAQT